jgi:hypothetical protein
MQPCGGNGNAEWPTEACGQFDVQLEGYLEGEHQPSVTAHAAACEYCGAVLADLLALRSSVGGLEFEEPPSGLWASLKVRLVEEGIIRWPSEACRRFDLQLQSYLEGDDRPELKAHAAACEYCAAVLADLALLRTAAGELEPEEPPARIWANVRAALRQEGLIRPGCNWRRAWVRWLWSPIPAAALAAFLVLAFVSVRSRTKSHPNPPLQTIANVAVDPSVETTVAAMERAFQVQSAALDPSIRLAYDKGLASLDGEIRECQASLARQPNDSLTREYLASAYTEKAEVLASALELGDNNVR